MQGQLSAWIDSLTEAELPEPHQRQWTGEKWAIVIWIQVNTISPYKFARTKVSRWKRERCLHDHVGGTKVVADT